MFLFLRAAVGPAAAAKTRTRNGRAYGKCVSGNSPYTVELTTANERRGRYCWTITQAEDACTRNKCCGDTPDQLVLRNLGEEGRGRMGCKGPCSPTRGSALSSRSELSPSCILAPACCDGGAFAWCELIRFSNCLASKVVA